MSYHNTDSETDIDVRHSPSKEKNIFKLYNISESAIAPNYQFIKVNVLTTGLPKVFRVLRRRVLQSTNEVFERYQINFSFASV